MKREYPSRPLVGVGVLVKDGDRFLLVKRGREPDKGLWSIPGGLVESGEGIREAGKREVEEETGLKVRIGKILEVVDIIVYDVKGKIHYHYVLIDFLGHPISGNLKIASDIMDARWVKVNELSRFPLAETLKHVLKRAVIATRV